MDFSSFIENVLKEASEIARNNFGKSSSISTKEGDNNQVLTETDLAVGKLIVGKISQEFPTHNIIDEEAGVIDKNSKYTWVVDPIDGTSNFANGVPMYGIMIGLLLKAKPVAGGVALPSYNETYIAELGKGSFLNDQKIHATNEKSLLKVLVAYTLDGHQENPELSREEGKVIGRLVLGIRNLRAAVSCFDIALTARGSYGGYVNKTSKIWDNVAPQIILEEAGCLCTDYFGEPMDYSNPTTRANENYTFCTATPILHQQIQEIIHKT